MVSAKQSPINRTYLTGIITPQAVELELRKLVSILEQNGMISSPLPGLIPLFEASAAPGAPVPGLLPVCRNPLIPAKKLAIDTNSGWVYWPVDSEGWISNLAAELGTSKSENRTHVSGMFPMGLGLPLARYENNGEESILSSPEVSKILEKPPRWRALTLVCWSVESISGRPWEQSVFWFSLWRRRLRRAPKGTNNNK